MAPAGKSTTGKSSKGPIGQPGLKTVEQHSKITSKNGIVIHDYLAKPDEKTKTQFSDHAPIVYDLKPINPFIRIITWNVANFGDHPSTKYNKATKQNDITSVNHKFPIGLRTETNDQYSARIVQIANAIADMYKNYKPLAGGIEPIIMCQELPGFKNPPIEPTRPTDPSNEQAERFYNINKSKYDQDLAEYNKYKPFMTTQIQSFNTSLGTNNLRLLRDKLSNDSDMPECNIICSKDTKDVGVIEFKDDNQALTDVTNQITDEKAKKQLKTNIQNKTSYFYKIYFETYLVIFVNVHLQFNVNCDDYINGILGMILRWLNTSGNSIGKYESLLSIIFVGDFNRSLLYQDFTNVNTTLGKFKDATNAIATMHLYTTPNDQSFAYADNAGNKNVKNVDYMMEVKFPQPFKVASIKSNEMPTFTNASIDKLSGISAEFEAELSEQFGIPE